MEFSKVLLYSIGAYTLIALASAHHEFHRIHIPTKIKTIYQTKIVKVPEHHHHYHEKEKLVPVLIPKHQDSYKDSHHATEQLELEDDYEPNKSHWSGVNSYGSWGSETVKQPIYKAYKKRSKPKRVKRIKKIQITGI